MRDSYCILIQLPGQEHKQTDNVDHNYVLTDFIETLMEKYKF